MSIKIIEAAQGKDGQWYIRIRNKRNRKIVADGGEAYSSKSNAKRAMRNNWRDGYSLNPLFEGSTGFGYIMVPYTNEI